MVYEDSDVVSGRGKNNFGLTFVCAATTLVLFALISFSERHELVAHNSDKQEVQDAEVNSQPFIASELPLSGGPPEKPPEVNCCGGGSACGYEYCAALGEGQAGCVQPWSMPNGMTMEDCNGHEPEPEPASTTSLKAGTPAALSFSSKLSQTPGQLAEVPAAVELPQTHKSGTLLLDREGNWIPPNHVVSVSTGSDGKPASEGRRVTANAGMVDSEKTSATAPPARSAKNSEVAPLHAAIVDDGKDSEKTTATAPPAHSVEKSNVAPLHAVIVDDGKMTATDEVASLRGSTQSHSLSASESAKIIELRNRLAKIRDDNEQLERILVSRQAEPETTARIPESAKHEREHRAQAHRIHLSRKSHG